MADGVKPAADADCSVCKTVRLSPENELAWEVIEHTAPGLFNGFGGLNYDAIEGALRRFAITGRAALTLHRKILVYAAEALEIASRKSGD